MWARSRRPSPPQRGARVDGYVTEMFSRQARFFQPHNAARIDAVRDAIETEFATSALYPLLLTSLIEAADRVDSTTGLQMAYVKQWAPRSFNPLALRVPQLLEGPGRAVKGDAVELAPSLGHFDLAYLDPPYNQHRYFTNYHVWETLVAWDAPEAYGVARKRVDARDPWTRSVFNSKRTMPVCWPRSSIGGLRPPRPLVQRRVVARPGRAGGDVRRPTRRLPAPRVVRGVATLAFDSARYVGARIGIFDPAGRKVGRVGHLSNRELLVIGGEAALVRAVVDPVVWCARRAPRRIRRLERRAGSRSSGVLSAALVNRLQQAT